jgi:acyl-CoA thioesterase
MWEGDRFTASLGMEMVELGTDHVVLRMSVVDDMVNGQGNVHGGVLFSLADSAFGYACNEAGPVTVLHSASIRYLRPVALGAMLVAEATLRSRDGRRAVYDVEVRDGSGPVARFDGNATTLRSAEDDR